MTLNLDLKCKLVVRPFLINIILTFDYSIQLFNLYLLIH